MKFASYVEIRKMTDAELRAGIKSMATKLFGHAPKCDQAYNQACNRQMVYASKFDFADTRRMVHAFARLQDSLGDLLENGEFCHTCNECQRADTLSEIASLAAAESGAGHESLLDDQYHRNNPEE